MEPHTHEFCELLAHIHDIKERLTRLESSEVPIKTKVPSLEEVTVYCASKNLTLEDSSWFWNKMIGSGWKNNGKPVKSWKATIVTWDIMKIFPSQKNSQQRKPSVFELKTALDLKKEQADRIKGQYSYETANGRGWNSQDARQNYINLRNEIKALEQRIGGAV